MRPGRGRAAAAEDLHAAIWAPPPAVRLAWPGPPPACTRCCHPPRSAAPRPPAPLHRRRIAFLGSGLLLANYVGAIALALRFPLVFNRLAMAGGHALLALVLLYKTVKLDAAKYSQQAIKDYYAAIWCGGRAGRGGAGRCLRVPGRAAPCFNAARGRLCAAQRSGLLALGASWLVACPRLDKDWGVCAGAPLPGMCPYGTSMLHSWRKQCRTTCPCPCRPSLQAQLLLRVPAAALPGGLSLACRPARLASGWSPQQSARLRACSCAGCISLVCMLALDRHKEELCCFLGLRSSLHWLPSTAAHAAS